MATSGTVSTTTFNTLKVVDQAFRRCRLPVQGITAEMHDYAKDALYLFLSELANYRTPSWCIEQRILPLIADAPTVELPVGAVEVLNLNYRTSPVIPAVFYSEAPTEFVVTFINSSDDTVYQATPYTVRIEFLVVPDTIATFQVSEDLSEWVTVGTIPIPEAGLHWYDVSSAYSGGYFRIVSDSVFEIQQFSVHGQPTEIPLGSVNRDTFASYSTKTAAGRPVNYWFQRSLPPVINTWPVPNTLSSMTGQLVVWYHRHIMDVGTLQQELELPQRWMEAIIAGLAQRLAEQTPQVDLQIIPMLAQRAAIALNAAWDGDNDGSSTFYQPNISAYTR